jgi:hypothetical protein
VCPSDRFAGNDVAHTALNSLSSLSSHISTEGQENDADQQGGGQQPAKSKVLKLIN